MKIEDIPTLEAAKTEIARLTVDLRNMTEQRNKLKEGLAKIMSHFMKTVAIKITSDMQESVTHKAVRIYNEDGMAVGHSTSIEEDARKDDGSLFRETYMRTVCVLDIDKLMTKGGK